MSARIEAGPWRFIHLIKSFFFPLKKSEKEEEKEERGKEERQKDKGRGEEGGGEEKKEEGKREKGEKEERRKGGWGGKDNSCIDEGKILRKKM